MNNTETLSQNETKEFIIGTEKQIVEKFVEKLPEFENEYIKALYSDLNDPERKFVWGEKVPGADAESMFRKAMLYTLEIVDESLKDLNEGEKAMLESKARGFMEHYGPKGTKSAEALQKMGDHLQEMLENGVTKDIILKNIEFS